MRLTLVYLFVVGMVLTWVSAWVTNAVYAFHHFAGSPSFEVVVSFVGILFAPLGALHGFYLWLL
ncbi:hypothetical protein WT88_29530 [Burkholderia stagnalis]|uniref:hypothetical protein n=1 Tax=Burkholderia TaxID=32008 RepID=UPI000757C60C|nr:MULTISPECIES: hypothetical protein [Burkholderia]KVZ18625.1 hypothetical protein WT35_04470 [Burkholderia stagnalis]KWN32848.1 hypothetical protein WT86_18595 [Burkholderia stagnalis]KWN44675.1 hypothetical protein WT88_29530 [Burkholderia stagnalis]KWN54408.1 hypothetical protein WT87_03625 [Burkholderia stagnalis]KWO68815.1 hypothetical protein WT99_20995 [Burkholderia stagnalis]